MSAKKPILPSIFEPALSLDNQKTGGSRSINLFERMAARLDEIAANTRGWANGVFARTSQRVHGNIAATQKGDNTPTKPVVATVREKKPARVKDEVEKSARAVKSEPVLAFDQPDLTKTQTTLTRQPQLTSVLASDNNTRQKEKQDKKAVPDFIGNKSQPRSASANSEVKEKRAAEENGNRIAEAVLSGMNKIGSLVKSGSEAISQDEVLPKNWTGVLECLSAKESTNVT